MANKNFQVKHGLEVGSTVSADAATGNITTSGDIAVNGGDITTTAATMNVVNTNATTVNIAGAGTAVSIGAATGTTTINNANTVVTGDLAVNGGDITTNQTTFNLLNTTATTLNLGGGAITAVNIGNTAGEIITPSDVKQTGNKSIRQGNGPYTASTDIYRTNDGNAVEGLLVSNNNMTNAEAALVVRNYGQNNPSGTTATGGPGRLYLGGTRGTAASPLASNNNQSIANILFFSNLGDTTGTGSGNGWTNDLYLPLAQPAGAVIFANQNHRQTLAATLTGSISGTTLTVTAVASGTIAPGQELRGTGFGSANAAYIITRQLTSTAVANALGSTGTYELSLTPGTIASSTMTTVSIAAGTNMRFYIQPSNVPLTTSTVNSVQISSSGTGNMTIPFSNLNINQSWFNFPQSQRIITAITGGNTLNIGTHGFTLTGASFTVTTAGNPNGLTTGTTYFIDTIPSSTTITLRTNSVSGGSVTGLTNGTGLFIEARVEAQSVVGGNVSPSSIFLQGLRRGQNFNGAVNFDNVRNGDWLGAVNFAGTFSNGSINNANRINAQATEDWSSGVRAGSAFLFTTTKDTTLNTITSQIGTNTRFVNDTFFVVNTAGTNMLTSDSSGNVIITGDLRINGNDIQNSTGNTTITMNTGAAARTIFAGDIEIDGNNIRGAAGLTAIQLSNGNNLTNITGTTTTFLDSTARTMAQIRQVSSNTEFTVQKTDATAAGDQSIINFITQRSSGGTYTPTQNNDQIGQFKFNGNAVTGASPSVPAGPGATIIAKATENWSNTANGCSLQFEGIKKGTTTTVGFAAFASDATLIKSDTITLQDSSSVNLVGTKLVYNRVFGQWQYDATITPAAANTAYAFPFQGTNAVIDYANIATATNTSRIQPNTTGYFNLQFSIQLENTSNAADHTAYIWWRKNGTDIANSMGRVYVTKQHQTIAGWNNTVEATATTDYFELMYAVDNVALIFPYFAATAFGPSTAAAFLSITPVGA